MQSSSGQRSQVELLRARDAAARLGVKLDTLYAYVSRGLLRSVAVPGSRERHYRADDVELFRASRGGERGRETLIPVIDSAICLIEGGRFFYRGHDAVRLAATVTLEEAAALDLRRAGIIRTGHTILAELVAAVTTPDADTETGGDPVHRRLAAAWGLDAA